MKRIRRSVTALLLAAPLMLTGCSDDDLESVEPGDVQIPPVESPEVGIPTEDDASG